MLLRRSEKVELESALSRARGGDLEVRADAKRAFRAQCRREDSGLDCEPSVLAEAGAILDAELDSNIHWLRTAYEKVHSRG